MISPLHGQLSPLRVPTAMRFISNDADVVAYVLAVEAADGERLEDGVISAYDSFVTGCKTDSIWTALKSSCILAGARTLSGALVPLVGTAPTNFNFVSGDYNRETGLKGNGTSKYINPNRLDNADPQNSFHYSVWVNTAPTLNSNRGYIGNAAGTGSNNYVISQSGGTAFFYNRNGGNQLSSQGSTTGLKGTSRSLSTAWSIRSGGTTTTGNTTASVSPTGAAIGVFARNNSSFSDARISFYSIGENLDLALLDTRVSTLMTDLAAAIP